MNFFIDNALGSINRIIGNTFDDFRNENRRIDVISTLCFTALATLAGYQAIKVGARIQARWRLCLDLQLWVNLADQDEYRSRVEAEERIIDCYNRNAVDLDLSNLELTEIPDCIRFLTRVQVLNLSLNELSEIPETISEMTSLSRLNVSHNPLMNIPFSVATRPGMNLIMDQYQLSLSVRHVLDQLHRRTEEPVLERELELWFSDHNKAKLDIQLVHKIRQLDQQKLTNLTDFLSKLRETADFKTLKTQRLLKDRVVAMIVGLLVNQEFCDLVFLVIFEALSSCVDRIALAFDDIESLWIEHFTLNQMSIQEKAQYILSNHRKALLQDWAQKICSDSIRQAREIDEIEIYLNLQIELRERLQLPNSTRGMIFDKFGLSPRLIFDIGSDILSKTSSVAQKVRILLSYSLWQKIIDQDSRMRLIDEELVAKTEELFELKTKGEIAQFMKLVKAEIDGSSKNPEMNSRLKEIESKPKNVDTAARLISLLRDAMRIKKSEEITSEILTNL